MTSGDNRDGLRAVNLVEILGQRLSRYLLSIEESEELQVQVGTLRGLNSKQQAVLENLENRARIFRACPPFGDPLGRQAWIEYLSHRPSLSEHSIGNTIRIASGGAVEGSREVPSSTKEILEQLVNDLYPASLIPRHEFSGEGNRPLVLTCYNHPLNEDFVDSLKKMRVISSRLQESSKGDWYRELFIRDTRGNAKSVMLGMWSTELVSAGFRIASAKADRPNVDDVATAAKSAMDFVLSGLGGEEVKVTFTLGIIGIQLPKGIDHVDLGFAVLRQRSERHDVEVHSAGLAGSIKVAESVEHSEAAIAGELVLEGAVSVRLHSPKTGVVDDKDRYDEHTAHAVRREFNKLRFLVVLAIDGFDGIRECQSVWTQFYDPLTINSISWSDPRRFQSTLRGEPDIVLPPSHVLSRDDVERISDFADMLSVVDPKRFEVPIQKFAEDIPTRAHPRDSLLDAVTVWESLLGGKENTALRVCAGMAWLVGDEFEDRTKLRDKYARIYDSRSNLVHGNGSMSIETLYEEASIAKRAALDAVKRLLENPKLAQLGSVELSNSLLLGMTTEFR